MAYKNNVYKVWTSIFKLGTKNTVKYFHSQLNLIAAKGRLRRLWNQTENNYIIQCVSKFVLGSKFQN